MPENPEQELEFREIELYQGVIEKLQGQWLASYQGRDGRKYLFTAEELEMLRPSGYEEATHALKQANEKQEEENARRIDH